MSLRLADDSQQPLSRVASPLSGPTTPIRCSKERGLLGASITHDSSPFLTRCHSAVVNNPAPAC